MVITHDTLLHAKNVVVAMGLFQRLKIPLSKLKSGLLVGVGEDPEC
jgi:hypothetical protein